LFNISNGLIHSPDFAVCAVLRFHTLSGFSETMFVKNTKRIQGGQMAGLSVSLSGCENAP